MYIYKSLRKTFSTKNNKTCNSLEYTEMYFLYQENGQQAIVSVGKILYSSDTPRKGVVKYIKGRKNFKRYIFHTVLLLFYLYSTLLLFKSLYFFCGERNLTYD